MSEEKKSSRLIVRYIKTSIFISYFFLISITAFASNDQSTGEFLYNNCKENIVSKLESSFCYGYIEGNLDGYESGSITIISSIKDKETQYKAIHSGNKFICFASNEPSIREIIQEFIEWFIKNDADYMKKPAHEGFYKFMNETYQCEHNEEYK